MTAFIKARSQRVRPGSLATEVGGVRSFLRYLCMRGLVGPDLLAHARTPRFSKEHRLPPVWSEEDVEALLASVDRSSAVGKRDYAILLLACRLALRAGDIRTLRLDELDWREARLSCVTQTWTRMSRSLAQNSQADGLMEPRR